MMSKVKTGSIHAAMGVAIVAFYIFSSGVGIAAVSDTPARPTFGMRARDMNEVEVIIANLPFKTGIMITGVAKGSVAEKAGLRVGDIIFECNGKPVTCGDVMMQTQIVPDGKNLLKAYRNGKEFTVEVDFNLGAIP